MSFAPIALFVYRRPEHTKKTLEALLDCPELSDSPLVIFCDGARNEEELPFVQKTRQVAYELVGNKATIVESSKNIGLANSIISGITKLLNDYNRVIVLEDDLIVNTDFLRYMNRALEVYKNEASVMQISGYMFPLPEWEHRVEAFFLPFTVSWGWATWKRAWDKFDINSSGWEVMTSDRKIRKEFNLDGTCRYYQMLKQQKSGKIDSWAIRWYWSVFQEKGYVLFPPHSYVSNIGFDGSGTHGILAAKKLRKVFSKECSNNLIFPQDIHVSTEYYDHIKKLMSQINSNWLIRLKNLMLDFIDIPLNIR